MPKNKIVAIIPAFNEAETISQVIKSTQKHVFQIIVVNDNSIDQTAKLAKKTGAIVISNPTRLGYDKSIEAGFAAAIKQKPNIILTLDADGQHNPDDIPKLVKPIIQQKADIVIGRRPYKARLSEYLFTSIGKSKLGIDDPLCGFKAYQAKVYQHIGYFDQISSIGTQLIFNAHQQGFRLDQKNIILNRRQDTPRFGKRLIANCKILKAIIKILWYYRNQI